MGGEFTSHEFNIFCKTNGISRQLSVAERKNKKNHEHGCILSEKQASKNFWPEAVNGTVHEFNRNPTMVVNDMTPEEAWSGVKPYVDYFRVFGCIGHVHVSNGKRKKFDDKVFSVCG